MLKLAYDLFTRNGHVILLFREENCYPVYLILRPFPLKTFIMKYVKFLCKTPFYKQKIS